MIVILFAGQVHRRVAVLVCHVQICVKVGERRDELCFSQLGGCVKQRVSQLILAFCIGSLSNPSARQYILDIAGLLEIFGNVFGILDQLAVTVRNILRKSQIAMQYNPRSQPLQSYLVLKVAVFGLQMHGVDAGNGRS